VIKGFAINNDGSLKVGFTAPSVDGQAEVIRDALALAQVDAQTISYIETHGTATPLGDPIEVAALTQVYREQTDATGYCAIGSVKTNIGHLDAAAGVAGLIKTVMALKHAQIPPSLHFERPNPQIDFAGSPFYVNTQLAPWPRGENPRRAGVSSFGIGGTNAHVVVEEAPPPSPSDEPAREWRVLPLSARTKTALAAMSANLAAYLRCHREIELADVAFTLQLGRRAFEHRQILVARTADDALAELESPGSERILRGVTALNERSVTFMFPGQGAQYVGMAQDLYADEPVFRAHLDRCAELFAPHLGLDLRAALYPELFNGSARTDTPEELLSQTWLTQPALFAVEYALAQLWIAWGVQPASMIGHSLGEYVAACLAGVFSLEDAVALIAARGRLMHQAAGGGMLSVSLPADELRPLLGGSLALAAINGPALCVVAGAGAALDELASRLADRGVSSRRLASAYAFHSAHMDAIIDVFAERVRRVALRPPTIPFISNVTGTWATADDVTDPHYWARQLRQTVRFAEGASLLIENPKNVLLEVGPGRTLISLARLQAPAGTTLLQSLRHPREDQPDEATLLAALGRLWLAGASVDWSALYGEERRRRVVLPTYPFERQRYWLDLRASDTAALPGPELPTAASAPAASYDRPDLPNEFVAPRTELEQKIALIWQECLGLSSIGVHDNFFELGGHSLIATQLIFQLREVFPVELALHSLFETPTIAGLAEVLEAKLIEKIASLSDEEIRLLM
jgi:acyl transferase domain-containing protein